MIGKLSGVLAWVPAMCSAINLQMDEVDRVQTGIDVFNYFDRNSDVLITIDELQANGVNF